MLNKVILILAFFLYSFRCTAPVFESFTIIESDPVHIYNITDPVLSAFCLYESDFNSEAVNPVSGAGGILQFMKSMIDEVNKICRYQHSLSSGEIPLVQYKLSDRFNPEKSIEMWYIVQNFKNPDYDLAKACQIWFGIGVQYDGKTWREYYNDIDLIINRVI